MSDEVLMKKVEFELEELKKAYEEGKLEDYVNGALGISLKVDMEGNMEDYVILVASGGPEIWIEYGRIVGQWWGEEVILTLPNEIGKELWGIIEGMKSF